MMAQKPLSDYVALLNRRFERDKKAPTLLGIGPMSEEVLLAALELGRESDFPVIFIASRNQVDSRRFGSGYVKGWDQADFVAAAKRLAEKARFDGPLYICRDHGGPWQRDEERSPGIPEEQAIQSARDSYREDLLAGFQVLHIDPTRAPEPIGPVPLSTVLKRTVELIGDIEEERRKATIAPVTYEVGTEETAGGLTEPEVLKGFIGDLCGALEREKLPAPSLVVGQTGTLVKMDRNTGGFNGDHARRLGELARSFGMGLKEHNADYLSDEVLRNHPRLGVTSANVAPEFGRAHTVALLALAQHVGDHEFIALLERKALESGRWRKWLLPEQKGMTAAQIRDNRVVLAQVADVCGHYVYDDPEVAEARARLFGRARLAGVAHPERRILDAIKASIRRYVLAFSLAGLASA
jgi:hypothetical protein